MTRLNYDIIMDFDDVIYPFCEGVMEVLQHEGLAGDRKITQWGMHKDFGIERDIFWEMLDQPKHLERLYRQRLYWHTVDALDDLYRAGHRVHIVTARSETMRSVTEAVLERQFVPYESLHFTKEKGLMVEELNASFSLDDRPKNYLDLERPRHVPYLMAQPHNMEFRRSNIATVRTAQSVTDFAQRVIGLQQIGLQMRGESSAVPA